MRFRICRGMVALGLAACLLGTTAHAQLPADMAAFADHFGKEARTPEGAAKLFFDAVFACINPITFGDAIDMLALVTRQEEGWERKPSRAAFIKLMTAGTHDHVFRSYAKGATPENGYDMDPNGYELNIERTKEGHAKGLQMYLRSGGADDPRVIYLNKHNDRWHVTDASAVCDEVKPPLVELSGFFPPLEQGQGDDDGWEEGEPPLSADNWPPLALLDAPNVEVWESPSAGLEPMDTLTDSDKLGPIVAKMKETGDDGTEWWFVQYGRFGQGWIKADQLEVLTDSSVVQRLAARVRRDYGHLLLYAEEFFGTPDKAETRHLDIPDFNTTVEIVSYEFHGHKAEYRDGMLTRVEIAGGFMDFGGIMIGTDAEESLLGTLGAPASQSDGVWFYSDEADDFEFIVKDGKVVEMAYRRAVYD